MGAQRCLTPSSRLCPASALSATVSTGSHPPATRIPSSLPSSSRRSPCKLQAISSASRSARDHGSRSYERRRSPTLQNFGAREHHGASVSAEGYLTLCIGTFTLTTILLWWVLSWFQ